MRYHARPRQSDLLATEPENPAASMLHRTLYGTTLETLGTIWNDTRAALRNNRLRTNETAASPARDAAAPNQPPTESERPGSLTTRKVTTREKFLNGHSASSAGHSTFTKERPNDVRTRPADFAAA